jgi:hypothetical protein
MRKHVLVCVCFPMPLYSCGRTSWPSRPWIRLRGVATVSSHVFYRGMVT